MKVAMSGMNGFIGKALANHLTKEGDDVYPINSMWDLFEKTRFFESLRPDVIFHLAAYGNHYHQQDERNIIQANIIGTYDMLYASRNVDYHMFYNFSSSSVTLKDDNFYSASKIAAEKIATAFAMKYNKVVVNIRPYSVYGPGEAAHRFVPKVIHCLKTGEEMIIDENAVHDWIFIDDFNEALLNGANKIGTGEQHSNKQVVDILQEISGKKLKYKPGKIRSYDNKEWVCPKGVPHRSIYEGLKQTYESFA